MAKRVNIDDDWEERGNFEKIRRKPASRKPAEGFFTDEAEWSSPARGLFRARVVEVHKRYAFISTESAKGKIDTADVWLATIAKKFLTTVRQERNFICVGDRVLCSEAEVTRQIQANESAKPAIAKPLVKDKRNEKARDDEDEEDDDDEDAEAELPQCVIQKAIKRRNHLARIDPLREHRSHIIASNVDRLILVASVIKPYVKWGFIDRLLIAAEHQGIPVTILLNKFDLEAEEPERFVEARERLESYRAIGYDVRPIAAGSKGFAASADFSDLKTLLKKKISLISGQSGVGKSTLVNLFNPEIVQAVEENADIFYKGRHTTSFTSFIKLGSGGYLIDTPGVKSFAITESSSRDIAFGFREFQAFVGRCRYRECAHDSEPDCAIKQAVEEKLIATWRYKSYLGILLGDTGREGRKGTVHDL